MAEAANQRTPIEWSLDDLLRYLTEELGYEKYAALCEMRERLSTGELPLTRQRHVNGKPYSPTDGKPYNRGVVEPPFFRSNYTLDLDHLRDQVRVVSRIGFDWWDFRYRISEQKARALWPAPAQASTPAEPSGLANKTALWIGAEAVRMKKEGEIPDGIGITKFAELLEKRMRVAAKTDESLHPVGWRHIKNSLRIWGLWPVEFIKIP